MKTTGLRDKVVLTTGATSGIGAAIAREAAARGAIRLLVGRNAEKLAEVEHSIRCKGGRSKAYVCNFTNAKEIETPCIARQRLRVTLRHAAGVVHSNRRRHTWPYT
jgi:NADP-dependent 3-hydroxy acid dehydrogenase YdfG